MRAEKLITLIYAITLPLLALSKHITETEWSIGQMDGPSDTIKAGFIGKQDHSTIQDAPNSASKSHVITVWANNSKSLLEMGDYHFQIGLGQQLFDQFLSTRVFHMIADSLQGRKLLTKPLLKALPFSLLKLMTGPLYLEITNVRIHKVRITGYRGTDSDIEVVEDEQGGKVRQSKAKKSWLSKLGLTTSNNREVDSGEQINVQFKDDEAKPVIHFVERNDGSFVRMTIKGLSFVMQAEYAIRSIKPSSSDKDKQLGKSKIEHVGNIVIRATDCVAFLEATPTHHAQDGHPMLKFGPAQPSIRVGKLDTEFSGKILGPLNRMVGNFVTKFVSKWITDKLPLSLMKKVPSASTKIYKTMETALTKSINKIFESKHMPTPDFPHLLIQDLRWWISNKKFFVGANIQHISGARQEKLLKMSERMYGQTALTIDQQRSVLTNYLVAEEKLI